MRIVLQRVTSASVAIAGREVAAIGRSYLVLLGIEQADTTAEGAWLAQKLSTLRLFTDEAGKMNLTLRQVGGATLVVSQFTLLGTLDKGTRPSFHRAAPPAEALALYKDFLLQLAAALGPYAPPVRHGEFGADMQVALVNDGPVTLVLDSCRRRPTAT